MTPTPPALNKILIKCMWFEDLTVVKTYMLVFGVITQWDLWVQANVSEMGTASIFIEHRHEYLKCHKQETSLKAVSLSDK
jgi:hypothetical protein